ncbi:MAG: hypothetical protein IPM55_04025 [Acidobacteria bacterium]|nr:hypothetical protein [Acidobacteriota bacterium]
MSRVTNSYDETGTYVNSNGQAVPLFVDAPGVIQHDAAYNASFNARGNLTGVTQYSVVSGAIAGSRIIKRIGYDIDEKVN